MLEELNGHEENTHSRRPTGHNDTTGSTHLNWKDELRSQHAFEKGDGPVVVILGKSTLDFHRGPSFIRIVRCRTRRSRYGRSLETIEP